VKRCNLSRRQTSHLPAGRSRSAGQQPEKLGCLQTVDSLTEGTTRWLVPTELRDRRQGRSATLMKGPMYCVRAKLYMLVQQTDV